LAQAIEAEVAMFLARYADRRDAQGRHAVVRNGSLPEREVHTGVGAVRVKVPRVRDRSGIGRRFHSALLPPYLRRSQSLAALLPWLSLQGVSTGDFWQGKSAPIMASATLCPFGLAYGSLRWTRGAGGNSTDARIAANIERGFCPKKRSAAVVPSSRVRKKL
jgi:hypothetical protein